MKKAKLYQVVNYLWDKFGVFLIAGSIIFLAIGILNLTSLIPLLHISTDVYSFIYLLGAITATILRLILAYILALLVGIPIALLIHKSKTTEKTILPFLEIIQSIPILAIFPILIILLESVRYVNDPVVVALFVSMLCNIVFNLVNGLKFIPTDVVSVAKVFKLKGYRYYKEIIFPAMMPYLVMGSFVAWAQGWNIVILAEVLHIFVPNGIISQDLFGIGSILISSISAGETKLFSMGIVLLILVIGLINLFVWQRLIRYSEKFKFK